MELSSLDLQIKKMMLKYPGIFPSRLECLHHLFAVNGNGYKWTRRDDGLCVLVDHFDDEPMPEHIDPPKPYSLGVVNLQIEESEAIRLEYEGIIRNFTEKHIDYLCKNIHHTNCRMNWINVYLMSWNYCKMSWAAENPYDVDLA